MITDERKMKIRELIGKTGFVSVRQLMDTFNISRSSAMRDLDDLQKQGLVYRKRGGASLLDTEEMMSQFNELTVREKAEKHRKEKITVCQKAASLVKDGYNIYIDSGTTVLYMLDYIADKRINIVTPNVMLLKQIPSRFEGRVTLLGGSYNENLESVSGTVTDRLLRDYNFDMAFMTANGVSFEKNRVFAFDLDYAANKKTVLERSRHVQLLIDHTKTNQEGFCNWACVEDFDNIFIDSYQWDEAPDNLVICEGR